MALGEDTILDAPVTPAPVFAYRALRAVIWGEEDTPEPATRNVEANSDKTIELLKRPRDDGGKTQLQLTPSQKRKRASIAQPSPSKSILRTPGVNTPRRALLRDMNVTFKDLRKSISPEIVRKEPTKPIASHTIIDHDEKENKPAIVDTKVSSIEVELDSMKDLFSITRLPNAGSQPQPRPTSQEKLLKNLPQPSIQPASAITLVSKDTSSFDVDVYMRNTEKEMKRLIKYGQKMRDYARRQEEENTKLRLLLDEMREENSQLKLRLGNREDTQRHVTQGVDDEKGHLAKMKASNTMLVDQQQQQQQQKPNLNPGNTKARAGKPIRQACSSNTISNNAAIQTTKLQPNSNYDLKSKPHTSTKPKTIETRPKRPLPNSDTNPTSTQDHSASSPSPTKKQRPSNSHHLISLSTTNRNPAQAQNQEEKDNLDSNDDSRIQNRTNHSPAPRPLANGISSVTTTTTNIGKPTTGLAPDRLAAARARVKRRAELRKTSSGEAGDENLGEAFKDRDKDRDKDVNKDVNGNGSRVETSLVDWAGL